MKTIITFALIIFWAITLNAADYSIIFFSSTTCGPCRNLHKTFDRTEIQKIVEDKDYDVYMVDIYKDPKITQHYKVRAIPHLFLMRNLNDEDRRAVKVRDKVGDMSLGELKDFLTKPLE